MDSSEQKTVRKIVVKYANKLLTHDIAKMSPLAQNLMSFLFSVWTIKQETNLSIDLNDIKNQLNLEDQRETVLASIVEKIAIEIINKSFVSDHDDEGNMYASSLIYHFQIHAKQRTLEVRATPEFVSLFGVDNNYIRYDLITFYSIKPKQAKNLFRLFCRNYKGHFTADWDELRAWMGYKPTAESRNIILAIKKAQKYLLDHKYLKTCEITPIYSPSRGHPIQKMHFEYTFFLGKTTSKNTLESPQSDDKEEGYIETKEDETALWDDFKPHKPEPEGAIASATPPDFSKLIPKSKNDVRLPTLADLPPLPPKESEPEPEPLEHHCTLCGKSMQIRQNKETGAFFWGCDRGHPTISLTPEEVRRHKNQKNSVNTRK